MATPPDPHHHQAPSPQQQQPQLGRKRKQENDPHHADPHGAPAAARLRTMAAAPAAAAPGAGAGAGAGGVRRRRGFIIREEDADGNVISEGPAPRPKPESVQRTVTHRLERRAREAAGEGGMEVEGPIGAAPRLAPMLVPVPLLPLPQQQQQQQQQQQPPPPPPHAVAWGGALLQSSSYTVTSTSGISGAPAPAAAPMPAAAAAAAAGGGGVVEGMGLDSAFFEEWPELMGARGDEYARGRRIEVVLDCANIGLHDAPVGAGAGSGSVPGGSGAPSPRAAAHLRIDAERIAAALKYFVTRGVSVAAFLPAACLRRKGAAASTPTGTGGSSSSSNNGHPPTASPVRQRTENVLMQTEGQELLQALVDRRWLATVPPGQDDDLTILHVAMEDGAFVVSNDFYRDHAERDPHIRRFLQDGPNPDAALQLHYPQGPSALAPGRISYTFVPPRRFFPSPAHPFIAQTLPQRRAMAAAAAAAAAQQQGQQQHGQGLFVPPGGPAPAWPGQQQQQPASSYLPNPYQQQPRG